MAEIISKSAYAARGGVNPAAVSNWIRRGRLTAPALRADGKIDVALADQQLGVSVDPIMKATMQRAPPAASDAADWSPSQQASVQLLRARALSASVDAERKRRDLNAERGKYTLTAEAEAEWARTLGAFLLEVDQSLADLAQTLGLDRQQAVALRRWWRNQRARAAEANRLAAAAEPDFIEDSAA